MFIRLVKGGAGGGGGGGGGRETALAPPGQGAIELGNYGGLQDEIEGLKRDKNVLMLELVRLRQQQQVGAGGSSGCGSRGSWF